jgi:hypothetical protein
LVGAALHAPYLLFPSHAHGATPPVDAPESWTIEVTLRDGAAGPWIDVLTYRSPAGAIPTFTTQNACETFVRTDSEFRESLAEVILGSIAGYGPSTVVQPACALEIE